MFPLKNRQPISYNFGQKTSYSLHHLGQDYAGSTGTPIYAPFDGKVTKLVGKKGGNTVWFYYQNYIMRMMHLSKFGETGEVKTGSIIGYVGSTGTLSTGSHLHLDISKNNVDINNFSNFIDPEKFDWRNMEKGKYYLESNGTVWYVLNGKKFYITDEKDVNYDGITRITNTNDIPGELLIPKSQVDAEKQELSGQITDLITQRNALQATIEANKGQMKELNDQLTAVKLEEKELDALYTKCQNENTDLKRQIEVLKSETISNLTWGQLLNLIFEKIKNKKVS